MKVEQNKSILIIEDSALVREYLRDSLEAHGFRVQACEDGPMALAAATKDVYHVIITDYPCRT
jgi:CheY-like chemotaxis protein